MERFVERVSRLYEQGADFVRIGEYVRHWWRWVRSGVSALWLNGGVILSLLGLVLLPYSYVLGLREYLDVGFHASTQHTSERTSTQSMGFGLFLEHLHGLNSLLLSA